MSSDLIILTADWQTLMRAEQVSGQWVVTRPLDGVKVNCLTRDPADPEKVFLGSQSNGVLFSPDAGKSWQPLGLYDVPVKALAVDPTDPQTLYAGGKPVSLYVSHDGGKTWEELKALRKSARFWWFSPTDPPGMTPYVNSLTVSPAEPNVLMAGMEVGAVLRSEDRGQTWSGHMRGCDRDCHALMFHPLHGDWVYEVGGFSGVAFSQNGGRDWRKPSEGLGKKYGWAIAADPVRPDIWFLSAGEQPNLLRGEFTPPGHRDGQANAHIYRKVGDAPWVQLSGGLPEPLDYMAYGMAITPRLPGHVFAGLGNGEVWHSEDHGDHWVKLPVDMGGVHTAMLVM